jgi:alkylated DNA nucleotide flippase Atl1
MKKTSKSSKKPARLSDKLVKTLTKDKYKTVTYGDLATIHKTNARAVGQAVKALGKVHPALANKVVYDTNTRPKKYKNK